MDATFRHRRPRRNVKQDLQNKSSIGKASWSKGCEWLSLKSLLIKGYDLIHKKIQVWHHTNEPIKECWPTESKTCQAKQF